MSNQNTQEKALLLGDVSMMIMPVIIAKGKAQEKIEDGVFVTISDKDKIKKLTTIKI